MNEPSEDRMFSVSLRLSGDGLVPSRLNDELGLTAEIIGLKGEPRKGLNGRHYAPYETHLWVYSLPEGEQEGFEEPIGRLFTLLGDRGVQRLQALAAQEDVEAELLCGYSSMSGQGGCSLAASTLKKIADSGLALTLDLYPPEA
jgi:hypothetical protein